MHLSFVRPYLSVSEFPETPIQKFSVITGPNGVGKTHLLKAIERGDVSCGIPLIDRDDKSQTIRYFDWHSIAPQNETEFQPSAAEDEYRQMLTAIHFFKGKEKEHLQDVRDVAVRMGVELQSEEDICEFYLALTGRESSKFELLSRQLAEFRMTATARAIRKALRDVSDGVRHHLMSAEESFRVPIFLFHIRNILSDSTASWGSTDLFRSQFSRLFVAYRNLRLENSLAKLQSEEGNPPSDLRILTPEEFCEKHGPPPWEVVNDLLAASGLDFTIDAPSQTRFSSYLPKLKKISSGSIVSFENLSSGEKILMSLAFCVYYASDRRQFVRMPKMLLLDEIDAPLHPSMSKQLIVTLRDIIVEKMNIRVIMTTHSPTTVALSPDDSIYVLSNRPYNIKSVSKASALNLLTVGVPTIAIEFSGRRQVFVESVTDSEVLTKLYSVIGKELQPDRSLEFISVGGRDSSGEMLNGGRDNVRRIVSTLFASGNTSSFGLIDWDGENKSKGRIHVLAESARNGLENIILDPLALAAFVYKNHPTFTKHIGLPDISYRQFMQLNSDLLSECATRMGSFLFGEDSFDNMKCSYRGGFDILIARKFVSTDDHVLEKIVVDKLQFFQAKQYSGSGRILNAIATGVLSELPEIIPIELEKTFCALLMEDAHIELS